MIEIVVVLVILFIVSAVVISRYTMTDTNELMIETDALKSSLRYAQIQSLNDDTATWGIHFTNDTSYTLYKNGAAASVMIPIKIQDPVKDPPPKNTHTLQGSVKITVGVGTTVTFDKWGSPGTTSISLTLTRGTENETIVITRDTGYIP
jgi:MSHA pilin protein MshC